MNVLELKTEIIILLPASYEKEWLENVVMLCRELETGKMMVRQFWRESLLWDSYLLKYIFVSVKSHTHSMGLATVPSLHMRI